MKFFKQPEMTQKDSYWVKVGLKWVCKFNMMCSNYMCCEMIVHPTPQKGA